MNACIMLLIKLYSELCNFLFCWRSIHTDTKSTDNFEKEKRADVFLNMFYILTEIMLTYKPKVAHYNCSFSPDGCLIFTSTEVFTAIIITKALCWRTILCSLDNAVCVSSLYNTTLIVVLTGLIKLSLPKMSQNCMAN